MVIFDSYVSLPEGKPSPTWFFFQVPGGEIDPSFPSSQVCRCRQVWRWISWNDGRSATIPCPRPSSTTVPWVQRRRDGKWWDGNGSPRAALLSHHIPPYTASGILTAPGRWWCLRWTVCQRPDTRVEFVGAWLQTNRCHLQSAVGDYRRTAPCQVIERHSCLVPGGKWMGFRWGVYAEFWRWKQIPSLEEQFAN